MTYEEIKNANAIVFDRLSLIMNYKPDFISADMVNELVESFDMAVSDAFSMLLCSALGFDSDLGNGREIWKNYAPFMIHHLDERDFISDSYYQSVRINEGKTVGEWELRVDTLAPFSLFVCDDPLTLPDGRIIPQIGFFDKEFKFLSVLQNGREWMTMMPNEIVTQRLPIKKAHGKVLTYGLGLGYFAYMCAVKDEVESITVVERDENVITLFNELILPRFANPEKVKIVKSDAFDFAENEAPKGNYDYIFADIWHDPSDGVELYKRFKEYEYLCPNSEFDYWIEKTLKLYM